MASKQAKTGSKTEAQRLVDIISYRYAAWKKIDREDKYWKTPEFTSWYKGQIGKANALLKLYDFDDIVEALSLEENNWMSSLRCNGLTDSIKQIRARKQKQKKQAKIEKVVSVESEYKPKPKTNILDKLR